MARPVAKTYTYCRLDSKCLGLAFSVTYLRAHRCETEIHTSSGPGEGTQEGPSREQGQVVVSGGSSLCQPKKLHDPIPELGDALQLAVGAAVHIDPQQLFHHEHQ